DRLRGQCRRGQDVRAGRPTTARPRLPASARDRPLARTSRRGDAAAPDRARRRARRPRPGRGRARRPAGKGPRARCHAPCGAPGRGGRVDAVKAILWDLAQSEFQLESSRLAEVVQDSMTQALRIPNRGVKQAGFYVLGGAAMPAVLIEIGFVTNPKEERRLKDSQYRDEIARAILAGLAEYKKKYDARVREPAPSARAPKER